MTARRAAFAWERTFAFDVEASSVGESIGPVSPRGRPRRDRGLLPLRRWRLGVCDDDPRGPLQQVLRPAGGRRNGGRSLLGTSVPGATLYSWLVSMTMLLVAIVAPPLGAWSDATGRRMAALRALTIVGAATTALLATVGPGAWCAVRSSSRSPMGLCPRVGHLQRAVARSGRQRTPRQDLGARLGSRLPRGGVVLA